MPVLPDEAAHPLDLSEHDLPPRVRGGVAVAAGPSVMQHAEQHPRAGVVGMGVAARGRGGRVLGHGTPASLPGAPPTFER